MEATVERDLIIAALIAITLHGLLVLAEVPPAYFSCQYGVAENKAIEISMVSAYRETEEKPPLQQEEKLIEKETGAEREKETERKKIAKEPVIKREDAVKNRSGNSVFRKETNEERTVFPSSKIKGTAISEEPKVISALPRYRENTQPLYPPIASRRGYEGTTLLSLYVREDGTVGETVVKKTSGYSILDKAAVRAAEKWLFEPASKMGRTIPLWVDVPIRFVIEGKK